MAFDPSPSTGFFFPGSSNLHADIYPSISAAETPSLRQTGKTVLITGAGRGIGRATALQYAHAHVECLVLCARTGKELDEVADRVREISSKITVKKFVMDVTNEESVANVAQALKDNATGNEKGSLHVLVNNAGTTEPWAPLDSSSPADWWRTFEVNLKGPYLVLHAFLPLLVATAAAEQVKVDVLNVSSIGAHTLSAGGSAYQTSKLALCRLTEFVDVEYGDQGVSAVSLHPGGVPTTLANDIEQIRDHLNDTPSLGGGTIVWLTAQDRKWLRGRYVSATWDVDVLEEMKDAIISEDKLKVRMAV